MPFIEVAGVSKAFPATGGITHVLRDVSFEVEHGHFVSIVGAMGSGKSTLLSILAGLSKADHGTVTIGGLPVHDVRSDAAFVFQNYSLLPWFSALENVRLAVQAACPLLTRAAQLTRAREALEQVGLGNALHRRPGQLSGGMRQRVAIARAFAPGPQLLFLDEPFGALDALTRETLQQDLMRLCSATERPVTVVMITNSVEEAILLSDTIVPMLPGPPATVGTALPVPLPRPRSQTQLAHDDEAAGVRASVIATLAAAVGSRIRRGRARQNEALPSAELVPEDGR